MSAAAMSNDPPTLSDHSIEALRSRAAELRAMARTARTADVHAALLRLADRFAALADSRAASTEEDRSEAAD